jgi:hypothetical protein
MSIITRCFQNLQNAEELNRLTDKDLKDIGLSRYDLEKNSDNTTKNTTSSVYQKTKNFISGIIDSWYEAMDLRDKVLSKYKHIHY